MKQRIVESPYVSLKIMDSILIGVYKEGLEVDLHVAKEVVKQRLVFAEGKEYPALADVRGIKSVTKEARDYLATEEGNQGLLAGALLVNGFVTAMISNLFLNLSRPCIPSKIFSDSTEAMQWLQRFVLKA